jgi:hypothetical protein
VSKIKRYLILISVLICLSVNCFAKTGYIEPDPLFHASQDQMKWIYRICALGCFYGGYSTLRDYPDGGFLQQSVSTVLMVGGGFCFVYSWSFE